jgi:[protein-PII] uridylyltransferase
MEADESIVQTGAPISHRRRYDERMQEIRDAFQATMRRADAGKIAVAARAALVDGMVQGLWNELSPADPVLGNGISVVAVGGYGRSELFPYSDIDLMFLLDSRIEERAVKEQIRRLNQMLWDSGLRVSAMTRGLAECERFDPENVEFTLSLLDARHVAGDQGLTTRLLEKSAPRLISRDRKKIVARLLEVTQVRHAKYGDTLFHLEPNIKECPGGLRDVHVCEWLNRLDGLTPVVHSSAFVEARAFLLLVRSFLHFRHGRDDNTLDWQTQDEAAAAALGSVQPGLDAAYWMRLYFRHARAIERGVAQSMEEAIPPKPPARRPLLAMLRGISPEPPPKDFEVRNGRIFFTSQDPRYDADPAHEPEVMLAIFGAMSRTGASLSREAESRIEQALPVLSADLEDGPSLWLHLQTILTGPFAGRALRAMHALGILELLIPEFHGIDALVIRDAYHRYTVDEHTFVLIDTLHALRTSQDVSKTPSVPDLRAPSFAGILRDLPHPALLFLAALLHDTGKGHAASGHALESARMARSVVQRLELDSYEAGLVLDIIRNHLEMSAALRRDVFDTETIRAFASRVQTPEALRMLTLFTYADIRAVHPDALTPWKAENLWNLHIATANFLDRNVDDERVASAEESQLNEIVQSIKARHPRRQSPQLHDEITHFLEGFPRRYLQTRTADHIRAHVEMASRLPAVNPGPGEKNKDAIQLDFRFAVSASELTLVTRDRPMLFASMAGALAAWGMNIVTADAFSNAHGVVVDSFRFTDTFRTLELNESERTRFVQSVHDVMSGAVAVETLLAARRRGRRKAPKVQIETRIDFDSSASTQSTLLQVIAQDNPGLLRALAMSIAQAECNIEVALIDTEGEMAIDVFYLTRAGQKLEAAEVASLRGSLLEAIESNAR